MCEIRNPTSVLQNREFAGETNMFLAGRAGAGRIALTGGRIDDSHDEETS